ncbi:dihydrofolate reductase family protein [Aeromicrobium sp. 9AM]|uniref:dihydrofolate reductase family protein n=1 Tax=Aeromicrobium sp. 9AM TaxID=2653126 RepID=UPI001359A73D|nr:dihydrofolate reductase family protein [Aeromicrobium sp. 9AM]
MRKLVAIEFLSVDGVMQGLGSYDEDREGGFEHGGWGAPYAEAIHATVGSSGADDTSAYLFGRKTYEKMAAFWPHQPDTNPIAASMNAAEKFVVTTTRDQFEWDNSRRIAGDVVDGVRAMKADGEGIVAMLGSGVLARSLLAEGVIDSLRLFIHPLLLGSGKRLFGDLGRPCDLTLTNCESTPLGSVILTYDITAGLSE